MRRLFSFFFFFFKQKTAYEIGTGDWSSDVCSSDLGTLVATASKDKKARVFNEKGEMLSALAHEGGVRSVKFDPKGTRLATASFDKKARDRKSVV